MNDMLCVVETLPESGYSFLLCSLKSSVRVQEKREHWLSKEVIFCCQEACDPYFPLRT